MRFLLPCRIGANKNSGDRRGARECKSWVVWHQLKILMAMNARMKVIDFRLTYCCALNR